MADSKTYLYDPSRAPVATPLLVAATDATCMQLASRSGMTGTTACHAQHVWRDMVLNQLQDVGMSDIKLLRVVL
jgi:hypothetical protein